MPARERSVAAAVLGLLRGPLGGVLLAVGTFLAALLAVRVVYARACAVRRRHRARHARAGGEKELDQRILERGHLGHKEVTLRVRGRTLYRQMWWPLDRKPRAVVVYAHGINGYGGFVAPAVEVFCEQHGLALAAVDHYSFGRSGGVHGSVRCTLDLASDIDAHVRSLAELPQYRGLPFFLLGSSMGGHIVLRYAAELTLAPQIRGVIAWAPAVLLAPERDSPAPIRWVGRVLRTLWPEMPILPARPPGSGAFERVEDEIREASHPLMYRGAMRASTGLAMYDGMASLRRALHNIRAPLLLQHGDADVVCDVRGSRMVYHECKSTDRELIEYKGGCHVLMHSPRFPLVADAIAWMEKRL
jgi:alpha-beta hydrolase superfamily lysophospholipase